MNCVKIQSQYNGSNSLSTPEPHYIPGYIGHVPQAKYRPGHTFGMTSHRILTDPCIHMSPRSVLTNIHPEHCSDDFGRPGVGADPFLQSKMALVESRVNSFGRQQYLPNMVPGYTGFVPRFQTVLGHTYSPACNRALARFEQDQWRDRLFNKELEALDGWRFCYKSKPWESPEMIRPDAGDLQQFVKVPCSNPASSCQQKTGCGGCNTSPCGNQSTSCQQNTCCAGGNQASSQRNSITLNQPIGGGGCGCSGSGSGNKNGSGFSILSRDKSLCDYGERRIWGLATEKSLNKTNGLEFNINPHSFIKPLDRLQVLYRDCEGMIPNYGGHVPGEIFRFGRTYGSATRNARKVLQKKYRSPFCFPLPKN